MGLRIAAITMLRSDEFFLRKWVDYYSAQLGRDGLYIFFDGTDQQVPAFCEGCHVEKVAHVQTGRLEGDKLRAKFLSERAASLLDSYDIVIGTDVDEFLVADPLSGKSLPQLLEQGVRGRKTVSGLGIDVGQNLREEGPVDPSRPFLSQRSYAKLSTRYTKASVITAPLRWGSGFHRVKGHDFHIVEGLYLFHFGCVDLDRIKAKTNDSEMVSGGWSGHLKKRAATIRLASTAKAKDWERATTLGRKIQSVVRSPFAWNKPAMFEAEVLVRIPERFKDII